MGDPVILSSYDPGVHTADLAKTISRLDKNFSYKDLSTIIVTPSFGTIPTRVVSSWLNMMTPPNNKVVRLFAVGMEVGEAYSSCIDSILKNSDLSNWKYILCIEHDNVPPPDGLIQLLKTAEAHPEFDAVGGLYFTKGAEGCAQIWGDPKDKDLNFRPQRPDPTGGLVECCGTGMGFTLFRVNMFKDQHLRRPWFKTTASKQDGMFSQDLYAWSDFRKYGHRCAIDCSVRVGHLDPNTDIIW